MVQAAADCPCPLERKVLIQTAEAIVSALTRDKKLQASKHCLTPNKCPTRCPASTSLPVACPQPASTTGELPVKACKSSELRAGVFYSECTCLKRDGLQTACRRFGCSDRCGVVRPAVRDVVPLGTAVTGSAIRLRPACCPGRKQAQRLQFLEQQAELRKRRPPSPEPEPLPLPPPPPYSCRGVFLHECRPDTRCPPRRPGYKMPCGGAKCKHWTVPKPCTLPVCRADCFEQPPGWPTVARC